MSENKYQIVMSINDNVRELRLDKYTLEETTSENKAMFLANNKLINDDGVFAAYRGCNYKSIYAMGGWPEKLTATKYEITVEFKNNEIRTVELSYPSDNIPDDIEIIRQAFRELLVTYDDNLNYSLMTAVDIKVTQPDQEKSEIKAEDIQKNKHRKNI
ncbi:hypothetical protein IC620_15400 [Hazenella sp. IB182357]|uniref:Uncharacterized protein n=1 Tax=Polycladospora coralii TaxID=2771432 RepID=A0A926NBA3_9BACL|nr:hypothetical protein [Polycladospora coralii]MBD1373731.1 hypothetical protein [Polycladospora coralii]